MSRHPRTWDLDVLEAAEQVLRRAQRRREVLHTALMAVAFLLSIALVGVSTLLAPAAPLVVLAGLLAAWSHLIGRIITAAPVPAPQQEHLRSDE